MSNSFQKLINKFRRKNLKLYPDVNLEINPEYDLYVIDEEEEYHQEEYDKQNYKMNNQNTDYQMNNQNRDYRMYNQNTDYQDVYFSEFEDCDLSDDTTEDEIYEPFESFDRYEVSTRLELNRFLHVHIGNWYRKDYLVQKDNQYIIEKDIMNLLDEFSSIFVDNDKIKMRSVANNMVVHINTPYIPPENPFPTKIKPLKLSVDKLQYLLDYNYIRKCDHFEYDNKPIIAQLNEDGTYSLDYEYLNSITEFSICPSVDKNDLFRSFFPHNVYTKIKINDAYFQLPIHTDSYHKTAFKLPDNDQVYEFKTLHEGLKNSDKYLQYALSTILMADQYPGELLDGINIDDYRRNIKIYLDEILICSHYELRGCYEDKEYGLVVHNCFYHLKLLRIVLNRLRHFNIKINVKESFFVADKVRFIDRDLSQENILIDRNKICKILYFPQPKTKADIDDYLDLVYECRDYSSILYCELSKLMIKLEFLSYLNSFIDNEEFLKTFILIRNSFRIHY